MFYLVKYNIFTFSDSQILRFSGSEKSIHKDMIFFEEKQE